MWVKSLVVSGQPNLLVQSRSDISIISRSFFSTFFSTKHLCTWLGAKVLGDNAYDMAPGLMHLSRRWVVISEKII